MKLTNSIATKTFQGTVLTGILEGAAYDFDHAREKDPSVGDDTTGINYTANLMLLLY